MTLSIENGTVVALHRSEAAMHAADVTVKNGRIANVSARSEAKEKRVEQLDAGDGIVIPGLLNAHTHSPENLARGAIDRIAFEDWASAVWPRLDQLTPEEIRIAVLLGCSEMLRSGTTAVVDHFRQTPMSLEAIEAAVEAYRESGMRFALAIMLRDRIMPPWATAVAPLKDTATMCREAIEAWHDPSQLGTIMVAPSAPHRCTDAMLEMVAHLSRKHGINVQTHVDETQRQREEAIEIYGHSTIRHLDSLGLLNKKVSLAHCVWVDETDLDLLTHSGTTVVHNPLSNLRLGSGIAPVPAMLDRCIAVALGTDGAASNDSLDMYETMKIASLVQGAWGQAKRPTVEDVLNMTAGAIGDRFGMADTGRIAAGQRADIVVFERADARFYPLNDIRRQLMFCGHPRVRHAVIDGRIVVRNGEILTFDETEVFREAERLTDRFASTSH